MVSCSIPNPVRPAEKRHDYFHWTNENTEAQKRNLFFSEVIQWVSISGLLLLKLLFFSLWRRVFGLCPCLGTSNCGVLLTMYKQRSIFWDEAHMRLCQCVSVCVGNVGEKPPVLAPVPCPFIFWLFQHYPIYPKLRPPAQVSVSFNWRNSVFTLNSWHFKHVQ